MTYTKIMAAVDETPAGAHALRAGAQIGAQTGAELTVLRVAGNPWRSIDPSEVATVRPVHETSFAEIASARVSAELQTLIGTVGLGPVRAVPAVRFGIAAIELARAAELAGADLLVLGRQPVGPLERRPAGRTLEGTLRRTSVPTLVVPLGQRTWQRVLAVAEPVSWGNDVLAAARAFIDTVPDSELLILDTEAEDPDSATGRAGSIARKALALWGGIAPVGRLEVAGRRWDVAGTTLKMARDWRADVVVIGHRRGESMESCGVAAQILHRAPCAVLIVPI
jgi:nucleotide-binding universal stress UspA family protein